MQLWDNCGIPAVQHWAQSFTSTPVSSHTTAFQKSAASNRTTGSGRSEGGGGPGVQCPPYLHPRGFDVELEDHYLVSGPHMSDAVGLVAEDLLSGIRRLHCH